MFESMISQHMASVDTAQLAHDVTAKVSSVGNGLHLLAELPKIL